MTTTEEIVYEDENIIVRASVNRKMWSGPWYLLLGFWMRPFMNVDTGFRNFVVLPPKDSLFDLWECNDLATLYLLREEEGAIQPWPNVPDTKPPEPTSEFKVTMPPSPPWQRFQ